MQASTLPRVAIVGAGAAGLWCAIRCLERGWPGDSITIIEPSSKTENDRTWSFWTEHELVPSELLSAKLSQIELSSGEMKMCFDTRPYTYQSIRSSDFYEYAKGVLAKARVKWVHASVTEIVELGDDRVQIEYTDVAGMSGKLEAEYALDSRLDNLKVNDSRYLSTLQHFGGWFVESKEACFNVDVATFMDFEEEVSGVAFYYVIPYSSQTALVELAVLSKQVWSQDEYDARLRNYIAKRFGESLPYHINEREYGVIPMTDQPLWQASTRRIWKIGTAAGWVQPSSGYAFARCARYAEEVAESLASAKTRAWKASPLQQIFNSVMLGHVIDQPEKAGDTFFKLFARNGAEATFAFLDESASPAQTLKLMWGSPKLEFSLRAMQESFSRILGWK